MDEKEKALKKQVDEKEKALKREMEENGKWFKYVLISFSIIIVIISVIGLRSLLYYIAGIAVIFYSLKCSLIVLYQLIYVRQPSRSR